MKSTFFPLALSAMAVKSDKRQKNGSKYIVTLSHPFTTTVTVTSIKNNKILSLIDIENG